MPDYSRGKIYRIVGNGMTYIGSTCCTLRQRLAQHVQNFKRFKNGKVEEGNTTSYKILETGNYDIVLIEDYPCERKEQLLMRERYYIENTDCINLKIPILTKEERKKYMEQFVKENEEELKLYRKSYYTSLKEEISIKEKEYRMNNVEKLKIKKKEYYENNKDIITEKNKLYVQKNKNTILEYGKRYRDENKECLQEKYKLYYEEHKDDVKERHRKYFENNKDEINKRRRLKYYLLNELKLYNI